MKYIYKKLGKSSIIIDLESKHDRDYFFENTYNMLKDISLADSRVKIKGELSDNSFEVFMDKNNYISKDYSVPYCM